MRVTAGRDERFAAGMRVRHPFRWHAETTHAMCQRHSEQPAVNARPADKADEVSGVRDVSDVRDVSVACVA